MFACPFSNYLVLVQSSFNCQLTNRVGPKDKHNFKIITNQTSVVPSLSRFPRLFRRILPFCIEGTFSFENELGLKFVRDLTSKITNRK